MWCSAMSRKAICEIDAIIVVLNPRQLITIKYLVHGRPPSWRHIQFISNRVETVIRALLSHILDKVHHLPIYQVAIRDLTKTMTSTLSTNSNLPFPQHVSIRYRHQYRYTHGTLFPTSCQQDVDAKLAAVQYRY